MHLFSPVSPLFILINLLQKIKKNMFHLIKGDKHDAGQWLKIICLCSVQVYPFIYSLFYYNYFLSRYVRLATFWKWYITFFSRSVVIRLTLIYKKASSCSCRHKADMFTRCQRLFSAALSVLVSNYSDSTHLRCFYTLSFQNFE